GYVLGLVFTYARGPWLGAITAMLGFALVGPRATSRLARTIAVTGILGAAVFVSPLGDRIAKTLPFFGTGAATSTVLYRQVLLERSVEIIRDHPYFGDQVAFLRMEDLRQGEGIIDFVNTYAQIALFYGLIGLAIFSLPLLLGMAGVFRRIRSNAA